MNVMLKIVLTLAVLWPAVVVTTMFANSHGLVSDKVADYVFFGPLAVFGLAATIGPIVCIWNN